MQICIAFLLVALGGGLYGLHTRICHKRECAAYNNGYMQAQKENKIRLDAVEQFKAQLRPIVPTGVEERGAPIKEVLTPDFMDDLRKNGRAVTRLKQPGGGTTGNQ